MENYRAQFKAIDTRGCLDQRRTPNNRLPSQFHLLRYACISGIEVLDEALVTRRQTGISLDVSFDSHIHCSSRYPIQV